MADIATASSCFLSFVAFTAQRSASISEESDIGEFLVAHFAAEAVRMPRSIHRLDDTSNDELIALSTAWCV